MLTDSDLLARPMALTPHIAVLPGTTVEVGEEVFFDASGTVCDSATCTDPELFRKARFEWDFGDGYVLKWGEPYATSSDSGIAVTHFYIKPGTYTVELTVSVWDEYGGDDLPIGDPIAVESTSVQITVTGQATRLPPWPDGSTILDMRMDGNLTDVSPNALSASWRDGTGGFAEGVAGQTANLTGGTYISVTDSAGVFDGLDAFTISFWAKKNTPDTYAYLIDNPGEFAVRIAPSVVMLEIARDGVVTRTADHNAYDVDGTDWNHYGFVYDGSEARLYLNGRELATKVQAGTPTSPGDALLIGRRASSADVFDGYIDEVRIYDRALSGKELTAGFELWHAPFHVRIAQYIYAQIPSAVCGDATNKLQVTVSGSNGYNEMLVDKAGLATEEVFILRNAHLPAGSYVLTARLLDSGDQVLDEIRERFSKPYDGAPEVGIDENNAFHVDGEPFFSVTPYILNPARVESWVNDGYINSLNSEGYYPTHDVTTWTDYLDTSQAAGIRTIGPGRWTDGLPSSLEPARRRHFARNSDLASMRDYLTSTRDHPGLLAWLWIDEPDLGGRNYQVPPPVLSAWTYVNHQNDPHHPVVKFLTGYQYLPHYGTYGSDYDFLNNAFYFGKKHFTADVTGFDIYPLEYRQGSSLNKADRGVMDLYADAIDRIIAKNHNLIPVMSPIEVCDIRAYRETPGPTSEQVIMEAWLNVVHGMKGISWFHYFEQDTVRYDAMATFTDQITRLTAVVLGPEPDIQLTDDANTAANRVDTMVREKDGTIYVFAVRVTEPEPIPGSLYTTPEPETITVTFTLDRNVSGSAEVFDESRSVLVSGGVFTDTFDREAVHIYKIPSDRPADTPRNLVLYGTPLSGTIQLDWTLEGALPPTATWQIDVSSGSVPVVVYTGIVSPTRAYTVPGLQNGVWYTVELSAMDGATPILTDTVTVMYIPYKRIYLPVVMRGE